VKAFTFNLSFKHGSFLNPAFSLEQTGQMRQDLVAIYLCDKSQPAQVYTQDGHRKGSYDSSHAEDSAVSANTENQLRACQLGFGFILVPG
jgi:hypothetical protein